MSILVSAPDTSKLSVIFNKYNIHITNHNNSSDNILLNFNGLQKIFSSSNEGIKDLEDYLDKYLM